MRAMRVASTKFRHVKHGWEAINLLLLELESEEMSDEAELIIKGLLQAFPLQLTET